MENGRENQIEALTFPNRLDSSSVELIIYFCVKYKNAIHVGDKPACTAIEQNLIY